MTTPSSSSSVSPHVPGQAYAADKMSEMLDQLWSKVNSQEAAMREQAEVVEKQAEAIRIYKATSKKKVGTSTKTWMEDPKIQKLPEDSTAPTL